MLSTMVFAERSKTYRYIDGNNNDFEISADSLIYKPVTQAQSSSGNYSGGNPKRIALLPAQFEEIEEIIQALLKEKDAHESGRLMGCGTLVMGKKALFIKADHSLKIQLESVLRKFLEI